MEKATCLFFLFSRQASASHVSTALEYNVSMSDVARTHVSFRAVWLFTAALLCANFLAQPANSQQRSARGEPSSATARQIALVHAETSDEKSAAESSLAIPAGTILPVRLNTAISSAKSRPGQEITGRIMQDVPLPQGIKIKAGSKVVGHIVEATPANSGAGARVSLQFDKLISSHQTIPITSNLRAIAGFMEVREAQLPTSGPGESDVYRWLTTVQVGGDAVFGEGGPVTSAEDGNLVVGKAVAGGVLVRVRAKEGTKCRGPIDGNDSPQALWVFSSDACGTYGLAHISIAHAGRADPTGVVVLASDNGKFKISEGTGMLLRVVSSTAADQNVELKCGGRLPARCADIGPSI
jgi:hypothetical protein